MDEPRITFNKEARSITADYLLLTDEGTRGTERRHYATLRVRYDKGGRDYFSGRNTLRAYTASIGRETEEDAILDGHKIGGIRGFKLFEGLGLMRSEPVARYSEKALRAYFDEVLTRLPELREDPRVARYFEPTEVAA